MKRKSVTAILLSAILALALMVGAAFPVSAEGTENEPSKLNTGDNVILIIDGQSTGYSSLAEALNAIPHSTNAATITVYSDLVENSYIKEIYSFVCADLTIDLNGHTISGNTNLYLNASATIKNGVCSVPIYVKGSVTLADISAGAITINENGVLNVANSTWKNLTNFHNEPVYYAVDSVGIVEDNISIVLNAEKQLSAKLKPDCADGKVPVSWTSDNESVAKVSAAGMVFAVGTGEATIKAEVTDQITNSARTATCKVTVKRDGNELISQDADLKGLKGTYGQKLSDIQLPEDWEWKDGDAELKVAVTSYDAVLDTTDYEAEYAFTDVEGYDADKHLVTCSLPVDVSQAVNKWTTQLSIQGWTYGETKNEPSAEAEFGDVTFLYSDEENGTYTSDVPEDAGTWYVKATVTETDNYTGLEAIVSFEIKKARNSVSVTGATGLSVSDNGTQEVAAGQPISNIIVTANDGYYFPMDYSVASSNGICVTRNSYTQLTISGTPTADVAITLPAATAKSDRTETPSVTGGIGSTINGTDTTMEYAASETADTWTACTDRSTTTGAGTWYVRYKETDTQKASTATEVEVIAPTYTIFADKTALTFDTKNEGYESVTGQTVTITNTGNSKVTLVSPTSSNFDVTFSGSELEANGTATLTITPKASLTAGEYNEALEVKTTQNTSVNVGVSFKVNGVLSVSLGSSASEIIEGQSVTLTAKVSGGSGTYAYTWYADDVEDISLQGSEVTVTPSATTTYKVVVTDRIENKSATATVTVISKRYDLTVSGDIAFDSQHIGYTEAGTKSIIIKNSGNADVTNIRAALTSADADAFTLGTTGMRTTLAPNGTSSISVTPKTSLAAGTYKAQVQIKGDVGVTKTIGVTFTVSDHTFEWKIDKDAEVGVAGSKHEECTVCGYKKEAVAIPALTKSASTTDDKDKTTAVKPTDGEKAARTGDSERSIFLLTMMLAASITLATTTIYRHKKRR